MNIGAKQVKLGAGNYWRRLVLPVFAIALIIVAFTYAPAFLDTHSQQDECVFGPVSNGRYREFLAEAKQKQKIEWGMFTDNRRDFERELERRFNDLLPPSASAYDKLAAMHAVIRALNGEYRNFQAGWNDVRNRSKGFLSRVRYSYQVDLNGHGFFRPFWRYAVVYAGFGERITGEVNRFNFTVLLPNLKDGASYIDRNISGNCPEIPPAEWLEEYIKRHGSP